jgi:DNA-binding transcriptional ArsR family regulator
MRAKENDDRTAVSDREVLKTVREFDLPTASKVSDELEQAALRTVHYRLNSLEEDGLVEYTPLREGSETSARIWSLTKDGKERLREKDND